MDYKEKLEEIFPELKESGDEQSKKWILEYLYDGLRKSDEQFKGQFKAAIAWLEKQGEQGSIINVPSREVILSIWNLGNEWKELTKGSISIEYGTQLEYIQKHWQESEYYLRAKQGEQKSAWSEEDAFRASALTDVVKSGGSIRPELRNEFVDWLNSLKQRIGG